MKLKLSTLAVIISLSSCAAGPNAQTGAVLGALGGAAVGGIIGHQSGHTLEGVALGGAVGAGGGALMGAQIEKPTQNIPIQTTVQPTMQQVVDWTEQGVSSDEIILKIKSASSQYSLTADDIEYLKKKGVSQRVIETMQVYK